MPIPDWLRIGLIAGGISAFFILLGGLGSAMYLLHHGARWAYVHFGAMVFALALIAVGVML